MDIQKLAKKCGSYTQTEILPNATRIVTKDEIVFTYEQLQAYTNAVIEECANSADEAFATAMVKKDVLGAIRKLKVETL